MEKQNKAKKSIICRIVAIFSLAAMILPIFSSVVSAESEKNTADSAVSSLATVASGEELPKIYLTTDDGKKVNSKTEKKTGTLRMTLPKRYAEYTNDYTTDTGAGMTIHCRGNSTFETSERRLGSGEKYSYKIKLDKKADLLGMGKSKHWVLIANFYDVTNMRNKLTYDLSGRMGLTYMQSRWVVVYLNGEYRGIYTLCESIRIANNRVDIPDWEDRAEDVAKAIGRAESYDDGQIDRLAEKMKKNLSWITSGKYGNYVISDYYDTSDFDITSGYLIEYDNRMDGDGTKFYTSHGKPIEISNPSALDTNTEMLNYVKTLLNDFEEAIYSENFCTSDGRHYSELCDVNSLIDYFLVFNLFKNIEFGALSIFLYIDGGKIYFGPCWDFDGGCGNQVTLTNDWYPYNKWFYMGRAEWWNELCGDPYYVALVGDRWFEIRDLVNEMMDIMPTYYNYIKAETDRDSEKYGMPLNWYMTDQRCVDFDTEYKTLYKWMKNRISWLDRQFKLSNPNIEGCGISTSEKIQMKITYNDGSELEKDKGSLCEYSATYKYGIKTNRDLTLKITTQHTSIRYTEIYVNGKLFDKVVLSQDEPAEITIPKSMLDTSEDGINIIRMIGINFNNDYYQTSYISIRARSTENPENNEYIIKLQDNTTIVAKKGTTITLPKITATEQGYSCTKWSDGENSYPSGGKFTVVRDVYLYYDWVRTDLFPDRAGIKSEAPKTEQKKEETTTAKVTTAAPVTTTAPITTTAAVTEAPKTTTTAQDKPKTTAEPTPPSAETTATAATSSDAPITTAAVTTENGGVDSTGKSILPYIIIGTVVVVIAAAAVCIILVIKKKKKN